MKRDIYRRLEEWKRSERRKPLVLNGARQVGKTYALKHFGKTSYEKMAYLNFEKDEKLAQYFETTLDPKQLIKTLSIHTETDIEPQNSLLIFDEIQQCPKALNSLKYFCEEANAYHVAAAGSLLGVYRNNMKNPFLAASALPRNSDAHSRLAYPAMVARSASEFRGASLPKTDSSCCFGIKIAGAKGFPVGKVNFLPLYPLTFFEFLSALGQEKTRTFLEEYQTVEPLPNPLHEKLLELLKLYFFIGGMPEAVAEYAKNEKLPVVREIQLEILGAYERDFSKYAPPHEIMKISTVWNQVHRQLAKENKKFIFSAIRKSARGRDYEEAIQWLLDAGLILKSCLVETPKFPLSAYADNDVFKIFLVDVGLLGAQSNLSPKVMIDGDLLFTEFKGALTENYVAQELLATRHQKPCYWTSEGIAKVDFLIEEDHGIYPLEVKAGSSQKKKSLLVYSQKYTPSKLLRATTMNLKHDGAIVNFPLYLISKISK